MSTFVYFLQDASREGSIKIGYSSDLRRRLGAIRGMSQMGELTYLAAVPGDREHEKALHELFEDDKDHGEWFQPTVRLLEFIDDCKKGGFRDLFDLIDYHKALMVY